MGTTLADSYRSTLPNRLNRMRVHMMHFREGDVSFSPRPPLTESFQN